jgi:hypothetical protein
LYRSIDWIFDKPGMWAQRDDWFCELEQTRVCSGIMSLTPNEADFRGLLDYAAKVGGTLTRGDQQLISMYFENIVKKPINLLDDVDAAFGQCTGSAPASYLQSSGADSIVGIWTTPAFVHKSGGWGNTNNNVYNNVCFSHNISRQLYVVGDIVINTCHFNPLASYWRGLFCEAIRILGTHMDEVTRFCSDRCYYHGVHEDKSPCEPLSRNVLLGDLNATVGHREPQELLPALRLSGFPLPDHVPRPVASTPPVGPALHRKLVAFQTFDMKSWSCGDRCPDGGCCKAKDCHYQCSLNPRFNTTCQSFKFAPKSFSCKLLAHFEPDYRSDGGRSAATLSDSLFYVGARLPEAPFTISAKIRSSSASDCQDIIAWGDGQGSWVSVEFRLSGGALLYGESPSARPLASSWREVVSTDRKLNDNAWHRVAVVREASGEVALYADGTQVGLGKVNEKTPPGLFPTARSARVAHTQDCAFDGDIAQLRIYSFAVDASSIASLH